MKSNVPRAKKAKRDNRIVAYIRLMPAEHARITAIATQRGYPHSFASVAAEVISEGLPAVEARRERP